MKLFVERKTGASAVELDLKEVKCIVNHQDEFFGRGSR